MTGRTWGGHILGIRRLGMTSMTLWSRRRWCAESWERAFQTEDSRYLWWARLEKFQWLHGPPDQGATCVHSAEWAQSLRILQATIKEVICFPLKFICKVQSASNSLLACIPQCLQHRYQVLAVLLIEMKVHFHLRKRMFSFSPGVLEGGYFSQDSGISRFKKSQ